jgi:hypothetical protein
MKKAYKKALAVIDSCENSSQTLTAYNYIWLFNNLYNNQIGCKELTRKLHARCARKRKIVESK